MRSIVRAASALGLLAFTALPASAVEFTITSPDQTDLHRVARDMTAAFDDKSLGAVTPGGLFGMSVEGYGTVAPTGDSRAWENLTGTAVSELGVAGVRLSKGLPGGLDVGGFYGQVASSDAAVYGVNLRYSIIDGGLLTPSMAIRATYTGARNTGDFDYRSWGADVSVSQQVLMFRPYLGAGYVRSSVRPSAVIGLEPVTLDQGKVFAGLAFRLLLLNGAAEYERIAGRDVVSLKLGLVF